jgi:hypothetical protein
MKKLLIALVISLFGNIGYSQLSVQSQTIRDSFPEVYKIVKDFSSKDWSGDHEMMVFSINNQSAAIFKMAVLKNDKSYDESIMNKAITDWADKKGLVDFTMVVFQYEAQLKSKGAY